MSCHCFSKLATLAQQQNIGREADLKALLGFLTEQGNITLGNPRFFLFYSRSGRRRPSIGITYLMLINSFINSLTPKSGNMSVLVSRGNMLSHKQHSESYRRQRTSSKREKVYVSSQVHGRLLCNAAVDSGQTNCYSRGGFRDFHTSTFVSVFAGAASEESLDNNVSGDVPGITVVSSDQNIPLEKPLKLLCGSCYLPHPDKEETGGEDAHFNCLDEQVIGVADGVGGWADLGVDAGKYPENSCQMPKQQF